MERQHLSKNKTTAANQKPPTATNTKAPTHSILQLQAEIGNRAIHQLLETQRQQQPPIPTKPMFRGLSHELIQPKLNIGQPGDKYGQGADRVAEESENLPEFSSQPVQKKEEATPNQTGLPDNLKVGIENLSGYSLDDVQVHYNSPKPAQLQALAYTQGTEIHVAPGQETHLPHEAWHVVQQLQGRVVPTKQLKEIAINDNDGLEMEADVMGDKAMQFASTPGLNNPLKAKPTRNGTVQRFGDWFVDQANNKRKVGVEITENSLGGNQLHEQSKTGTWDAVVNKAGAWTHTVDLKDPAGRDHTWQISRVATMNPVYFNNMPAKHKWMKWDNINFTEDHGDIEWIIDHPSTPQGVTEYYRRLAACNDARQEIRNQIAGSGIGPGPYYLSKTVAADDGDVIRLDQSADNRASSQITFESNNRDNTKRGLLVGLSHGLDEDRTDPGRHVALRNVDATISATVTTAATRLNLPNVDTELVMAYVVSDIAHKAITIFGAGQWNNAASNFKSWRRLFPKSHPSQILLQSMDALPTMTDLNTIRLDLAANRANILTDIMTLIATKMLADRVHPLFQPADFLTDPAGGRVENTLLHGGHIGGVVGLRTDLETMIDAVTNNFLNNEYDHTIDALLDLTGTQDGVVKSSGFARHSGSNKGFAFEDRAEVNTTFPNLTTTYQRIKALVNRY